MKLHPYITFKNDDDLLICSTKHPHYLGLISPLQESEIAWIQIAGYNLYVSFKGTLQGNFILLKNDMLIDVKRTVEGMAEYYLLNRIEKFPDRYKKDKI